MNGALDILPPLQEVNHQIPLIDRNKRYKYHALRCPDSLKNGLSKKIKQGFTLPHMYMWSLHRL